MEYIAAHPDDFAPFLPESEEGETEMKKIQDYCAKMSKPAEWGGHLEILALVCLFVFSEYSFLFQLLLQSKSLELPVKIFHAHAECTVVGEEFVGKQPITIAYFVSIDHQFIIFF